MGRVKTYILPFFRAKRYAASHENTAPSNSSTLLHKLHNIHYILRNTDCFGVCIIRARSVVVRSVSGSDVNKQKQQSDDLHLSLYAGEQRPDERL